MQGVGCRVQGAGCRVPTQPDAPVTSTTVSLLGVRPSIEAAAGGDTSKSSDTPPRRYVATYSKESVFFQNLATKIPTQILEYYQKDVNVQSFLLRGGANAG